MIEDTAPRTRMTKDGRRQAIFHETVQILSERGYHGFNLNELAKRCNLTYPGLLHHFPTKEALLVALLQERDRVDQQAISASLGLQSTAGPQSLDTCLRSFHEIAARNASQPDLVRLYSILRAEALVPDHPAFEYFRDRDLGIIASFQEMIGDLVRDPFSVARQILAQMHGMEVQWLRENRAFDLASETDGAVRKLFTPAP